MTYTKLISLLKAESRLAALERVRAANQLLYTETATSKHNLPIGCMTTSIYDFADAVLAFEQAAKGAADD